MSDGLEQLAAVFPLMPSRDIDLWYREIANEIIKLRVEISVRRHNELASDEITTRDSQIKTLGELNSRLCDEVVALKQGKADAPPT